MVNKKRTGWIIFGIFILSILLLTYSHAQDEGCCLVPSNPATCSALTETQCRAQISAEDWSDSYFSDASCSIHPYCTNIGCCYECCETSCVDSEGEISWEGLSGRQQAFCEDRSKFIQGTCDQTNSACLKVCCVCVDSNEVRYPQSSLKTKEQCKYECKTEQLYPSYFYDDTITSLSGCISEYSSVTGANLSGIITEQSTNIPIQGVLVSFAGFNQQTNSTGGYSLVNVPLGSNTVRASKSGFSAASSSITIIAGKNTKNLVLSPYYDIGLIKVIVKDENNNLIPDVLVSISSTVSLSNNTNLEGEASFSNLPLLPYQILASKEDYQSVQASVELTDSDSDKTLTLQITKKPVGEIKGAVKSKETNSPIKYARVIINNAFAVETNSLGEYSVKKAADSIYSIYVEAAGYKSSETRTISLGLNEIETLNFELIPVDSACLSPQSKPVQAFSASHVLGKKAVSLAWTAPFCNNIVGYSLVRTGNVPLTRFLSITELNHPVAFIDTEVEWNTQYTYEIKAVYDDSGNYRYSTGRTASIITGDSACEGKYSVLGFTEFCMSNTQRKICSNENTITSAPSTNVYPSDCSASGAYYFCAGPDFQGKTYCKNMQSCNPISQLANPFGMFYTKNNCYGQRTNQGTYVNYCFYDYSLTTRDICIACNQSMTCYDYRSKNACETDNCVAANNSRCRWLDTEYSELGKGICYQERYNNSDQCWRCSSSASLFKNTGCTQAVCSALGKCFSDSASSNCESCENRGCSDLLTQQACTNGQSFEIAQNLKSYTLSSDVCGFGRCRWDTSQRICYKDGNANNDADCDSSGADTAGQGDLAVECNRDNLPPSTRIPSSRLILTNEIPLTFYSDSDAYLLYYCVYADKNSPCSSFLSKPFTETSVDLSKSDISISFPIDQRDVNYYIRYYTVDKNYNQELVNENIFHADTLSPSISINHTIIGSISQQNNIIYSKVVLDIALSEYSNCQDRMIFSDTCSENSESCTSQTRLSASGTKWIINYTLPDGLYKYQISCTDLYNNRFEITDYIIDVDVDKNIEIISPKGPVHDTGITFKITTVDNADCHLYKGNNKVALFSSSEGKTHETQQITLADNTHYPNYRAVCIDRQRSTPLDTKNFYFTIDNQPPLTNVKLISKGVEYSKSGQDWYIWFGTSNSITVSFNHSDAPLAGFNFNQTRYCRNESLASDCAVFSNYRNPFSITRTSKLCYYSLDNGQNEELISCGTIDMNSFSASIDSPNLGVSYLNIFDLIINTTVDAESCKFQNTQRDFEYSQVTLPRYEFEKISSKRFIIRNFPSAIPEKQNGFAPNENYTLYVKCNLTAGEISIPITLTTTYDPSAPSLYAYASKSTSASPENDPFYNRITDPETTFVWFNAKTDDPSMCKYSESRTDYDEMEGAFPEYASNRYVTQHSASLFLTPDFNSKTHYYNIACKNKAGNISSETVVFYVDFNNLEDLMNIITPVNGSVFGRRTVDFKVATTDFAECSLARFSPESFGLETPELFRETNSYNHLHNLSLAEGSYSYKVFCDMQSRRELDKLTYFTVDLNPPLFYSVSDDNYACGLANIEHRIEFNATDMTPIRYSYTLFNSTRSAVLSGNTTDSVLNIDIPLLSDGKRYYFNVFATDQFNRSSNRTSDGFIAATSDNINCKQDSNPPSVSLETTVVRTGVELKISCSDAETACSNVYYGSYTSGVCAETILYTNPIHITSNQNICYEALDVKDNLVRGNKTIAVPDSDNDGVTDPFDVCPEVKGRIDLFGCNEDSQFIELVDPVYGVSDRPYFNLTIKTSRLAEECRFSAIESGAQFSLLTEQRFKFIPDSGKQIHKYYNFPVLFRDNAQPFSAADTVQSIWIVCNVSKGNNSYSVSAPFNLDLRYDPSPPVLEFDLTPATVISSYDSVQLKAKTDDPSICRYDTINSTFAGMRYTFPGYDEKQFSTNNTKIISAADLSDYDKQSINYTTICMNKAGHLSASKTAGTKIDFQQGGNIISKYPTGFINRTNITLSIETDEKADCYLGLDEPMTSSLFSNKVHTIDKMGLPQGVNSFNVRCMFAAKRLDDSISFTVDITPPIISEIRDGNYSCSLDEVNVEIDASEAVSSISEFEYSLSLMSGASSIKNGTTTSSSFSISGLNLTENSQYKIKARARDTAGLWSAYNYSNGFIAVPSTSSRCDETDIPDLDLNKTAKKNGIEIKLLCKDSASSCRNISFGLSKERSSCKTNTSYKNPVLLEETRYVCYTAQDASGNSIPLQTEKIDVRDSDNDGIIDDFDKCENSEEDAEVDDDGCEASEKDTDNDGIRDLLDQCPHTPPGERLEVIIDPTDEYYGCAPSEIRDDDDADNDGVEDSEDECANTPRDEETDSAGCSDSQKDTDMDGVKDDKDQCPNTPFDSEVDLRGCAKGQTPSENLDGDSDPSEPGGSAFAWLLLILGILLLLFGLGYLGYIYYSERRTRITMPEETPSRSFESERRALEAKRQMLLAQREEALRRSEQERFAAERLRKSFELKTKNRKKVFDIFETGQKEIQKDLNKEQQKEVKGKQQKEAKEEQQQQPKQENIIKEKLISKSKETKIIEKQAKAKKQKPKKSSKKKQSKKTESSAKQPVMEKQTEYLEEKIKIPGSQVAVSEEQKKKMDKIFKELAKIAKPKKQPNKKPSAKRKTKK